MNSRIVYQSPLWRIVLVSRYYQVSSSWIGTVEHDVIVERKDRNSLGEEYWRAEGQADVTRAVLKRAVAAAATRLEQHGVMTVEEGQL